MKLFIKRYLFLLPCVIFLLITVLFFYKTVFLGKLPFPGDLLLAEYNPWRHTSYFGYVAGSIPNKAQYFDVIRELYPWKTVVVDQIKGGQIPLWNPYNFSGTPLLANYQSQAFYPLSFIYFIFSQPVAWTILIMLQPLLGMCFTYLFAKQIGISRVGSILVAIFFNFSSFASVWIEFNTVWHTILWLPLLLYLIERTIKQKYFTLLESCVFVFALFSSITAGHPQDFINGFLFFIIYSAIRLISSHEIFPRERRKLVIYLGILITYSFLIAAPQILPTIDLFMKSSRVVHDYKYIVNQMLIQLWQLPMIISMDIFGNPATRSFFLSTTYVNKTISIGIVGFLLAVYSFFIKNKLIQWKIFVGTALFVILVSVNTPAAELFYRFPIPILSTGTPNRILFLFLLATAILAGYGFDALNKKIISYRKACLIGAGTLVLLWSFTLIAPRIAPMIFASGIPIMKRGALFSSIFISLFVVTVFIFSRISRIIYLLIGIAIIELLYGFIKFNPFVPQAYFYPNNEIFTFLKNNAGINRFWGYGTAQIDANYATQYSLYSPDGTDPLNNKSYNAFIQTSNDGNIANVFTRSTRSDVSVQPGYGERNLPDNKYRLKILDMLGVRYVLDRTENPKNEDTFHQQRFTPVFHFEDWTIFENKLAVPRLFLTSSVRFYSSNTEFESIFFHSDFEPGKTILLEKNDKENIPNLLPGNAKLQLISYTPNKIRVNTETDSQQMLFLSDTYDTGWIAHIDETKTKIYKTNYAFRSLVIPQGKHEVTFIYKPVSFLFGGIVSLATLFTGFIIFFVYLKGRYSDTRNKLRFCRP